MNAQPKSGVAMAARYAIPFVLLLIPLWMATINAVVPEPYLDEAFHVPQAQAYWAHKWTHWDPKITTPPGLYLWSYVLCAVALFLRGSPAELTPEALRATNVAATAVALPLRLQTLLDRLRRTRNIRPSGAWLSHTVLNICLFPPLFFFSGLYYTDILALLVVIEAYNWDLKRSQGAFAPLQTLIFIVLGLAALAFRQTNIFWVAIFLGGLQVVRRLRLSSKRCESSGFADVAKAGWTNELYDPFVLEASIADYFKTAVSLVLVAVNNLGSVISSAVPYLIILAGFGGFVLWNGGVVLGHKEFHTAGLHLPQMLYIWPYFVFFSWPLLLSPVVNLVLPKSLLPKFLDFGFPKKQKGLPKLLTALVVLPVMLAVVHFNTIVHPFTLADNRHYVFYVFRILLRTHPAVKYAAVVVYFLCAWMVLSAFGFSTVAAVPQLMRVPQPQPVPVPQEVQKPDQKKVERRKTKKANPKPEPKPGPIPFESFARIQEHIAQRQKQHQGAPQVSFVLVWLVATALSLITAPLVEPRYFIIPWVMWRLHLPPQPTPVVHRQRARDAAEELNAKVATNMALFLETYWFLVINAVTGYIFLYCGFEWPQEPGRVQRFITSSLHRSITPPSLSRATAPPPPSSQHNTSSSPQPQPKNDTTNKNKKEIKILPSPIQLTHIRDLPQTTSHNFSTIQLHDILSSPLIRECWQFNYLFDVDFLMNQFDEDVRHLVKVKVVHGSWKKEAENRVRIDEACTRYPNVESIVAYMPEPFGTHHSKMMVLVRWDDVIEIIIHTANMIPADWTNMTQAVWRSPPLPLSTSTSPRSQGDVGPGGKFKRDLLSYLRAYGPSKTGKLVEQLEKYDFGAVRAALVASVPSKVKVGEYDERKTRWGWLGLRDVLRSVPVASEGKEKGKGRPHIVTQISSIATLGQTPKWLQETFFTSLAPKDEPKPAFSIIFPTPDEIRRSLNGYASGGSIHMKLQSAAQQKQLQYLRLYLCRWAGDEPTDRDAGRRRAAPHIKTYIRYASEEMDRIDWAMVTSANFSTQAWGAAVNANGEVRVCSWEIGVVVWPDLLAGAAGEGSTVMVPCFRTDMPDAAAAAAADADTVIGFRMPYDLPLTRYSAEDTPWCATASHSEPDWLGQTWED
ncbi:phospholipase D/nuclease [Aspergillus sclerotiicarbonarius CBS 121057]|uniref:Dol-P-Glc:Glc(2)Man(9)GlcNAc(2)-PP-Dol alpha-1,2-glucosyltransferase n=1 Tax=Aspergillus sclerotiicarbonarius (strain CBS 121057 / IBT 28362) TaxID=1448318 RepID=A0A319EF50_ASPSB|nr:phospholipase D/nuclease [Aspergillus sclerotiicarbonarius CBS 121057]